MYSFYINESVDSLWSIKIVIPVWALLPLIASEIIQRHKKIFIVQHKLKYKSNWRKQWNESFSFLYSVPLWAERHQQWQHNYSIKATVMKNFDGSKKKKKEEKNSKAMSDIRVRLQAFRTFFSQQPLCWVITNIFQRFHKKLIDTQT